MVGQRHLVDVAHVGRGDHVVGGHVAEQGDLGLDVVGQLAVGAAEDQVGLDADLAQVLDAVLGGLGLELAGRAHERNQRDVDEQGVRLAQVVAELPDRLEEGEALDVAHRAADLHDDEVGVAAHLEDALLDLVGDVRDHLDGFAEVIPPPLLLDHRQVNLAGGQVAVAGEPGGGEPLVVAEVEIGFGPVVGHEYLAVLERAHGAGVDVQVRVQLAVGDPVTAGLEEAADGRGRDAFAQGRQHTAGDENELGSLHESSM